jgi:hypothetical protein
METTITHILPLTLIRRRRLLPIPGKVLVSNGQKVIATQIVAEVGQPGQHFLVDVRQNLGLSRIDQSEKLIKFTPGSRITAGDVIAETGGLFANSVHSPANGKVVAISAGRVLIEGDGTPIQLQAGLSGTVTEVITDRGVEIETNGALIQGWIGNNLADQGVMLMVARSPDDDLNVSRMDVSMRGAVVVGGHCNQAAALKAMGDFALRGLILSSITAEMIPLVQQATFPVLVIEGIGKLSYCQQAFQLLTTNEKREVCVNAATYDPYKGIRPELIVPLPGIGELPPQVAEFAPGLTVRILCAPYASQTGTLIQVRPGKTRLKSGIHAMAGDVRMANNQIITIPLANLDVLE